MDKDIINELGYVKKCRVCGTTMEIKTGTRADPVNSIIEEYSRRTRAVIFSVCERCIKTPEGQLENAILGAPKDPTIRQMENFLKMVADVLDAGYIIMGLATKEPSLPCGCRYKWGKPWRVEQKVTEYHGCLLHTNLADLAQLAKQPVTPAEDWTRENRLCEQLDESMKENRKLRQELEDERMKRQNQVRELQHEVDGLRMRVENHQMSMYSLKVVCEACGTTIARAGFENVGVDPMIVPAFCMNCWKKQYLHPEKDKLKDAAWAGDYCKCQKPTYVCGFDIDNCGVCKKPLRPTKEEIFRLNVLNYLEGFTVGFGQLRDALKEPY